MLRKEIYINGFSSINPIKDLDEEGDVYRCVEPDYKNYIDTGSVRRLGKIQRIALVGAKMCLEDANLIVPDAIITGTGLGCLSDTEKFLGNMLDEEAGLHSPTSFIQSTHNTISGQIAIMLKCHGYNNTYSHRGLSFERALEDACLLVEEGTENVLVGAVDEIPESTLRITQKIKTFHSETNKEEPVAGEGVHYFIIANSKLHENSIRLLGSSSLAEEVSYEDVVLECNRVLFCAGIEPNEVDTIVLGNNPGLTEPHYQQLKEELFSHSSVLQFKNLVGESFTASAFGMILACKLLSGEVPDKRFYLKNNNSKAKTVLVYNHFKGTSHSFFILQNV
ncbi:MAG: beta-ketoacyl synthase chain length factor [Opitutaceae bacterium]|nr:beta-ketoacyl synthase chain length factor [Cytophagales bacterium]